MNGWVHTSKSVHTHIHTQRLTARDTQPHSHRETDSHTDTLRQIQRHILTHSHIPTHIRSIRHSVSVTDPPTLTCGHNQEMRKGTKEVYRLLNIHKAV